MQNRGMTLRFSSIQFKYIKREGKLPFRYLKSRSARLILLRILKSDSSEKFRKEKQYVAGVHFSMEAYEGAASMSGMVYKRVGVRPWRSLPV